MDCFVGKNVFFLLLLSFRFFSHVAAATLYQSRSPFSFYLWFFLSSSYNLILWFQRQPPTTVTILDNHCSFHPHFSWFKCNQINYLLPLLSDLRYFFVFFCSLFLKLNHYVFFSRALKYFAFIWFRFEKKRKRAKLWMNLYYAFVFLHFV